MRSTVSTRRTRANSMWPPLRGMLGADLAKRKGDQQALVNGLALTFFAIARIFGIPCDEAEDYIPPQAG